MLHDTSLRSQLNKFETLRSTLTVLLAGYLAQEVASLFREILGHASLTLYDETTAHLLCSNYWLKPIYQELVHASSRAKATRMGEPCSGLVRVSANPKPTKAKRPTWHTKRVSDWIGGLCPVDTLHLWFPAHCAPRVIRRLHEKEQAHRAAHLAWFDLPGVREELFQKHKDAKEAREMSFKIANFATSDAPFLTCSLRVDWLSIPVQSLLERRPPTSRMEC